VDEATWDLSVKNPHKKDETALRSPAAILKEIEKLEKESAKVLESIRGRVK
jgi:type I restriction enzyme M protein